ncbi:P-loop containing nucleoside triphosphate hydrolase protein [Syncephalis plumigaleata]|nr:P-loop containing nucleoside triphosphate hydrolase protein [Syncephalis plumigaleata]
MITKLFYAPRVYRTLSSNTNIIINNTAKKLSYALNAKLAQIPPLSQSSGFKTLGIHPSLQTALHTEFNISTPTATQKDLIPAMETGRDVFVRSETGSGKSFAILLALLNREDGPLYKSTVASSSLLVKQSNQSNRRNNVISTTVHFYVVPSRELASQLVAWAKRLVASVQGLRWNPDTFAILSSWQYLIADTTPSSSVVPWLIIGTPNCLQERLDDMLMTRILNRQNHPKPAELLVRAVFSLDSPVKPQLIACSATMNRAIRHFLISNRWVTGVPELVYPSVVDTIDIASSKMILDKNNEDTKGELYGDPLLEAVLTASELDHARTVLLFIPSTSSVATVVKRLQEFGAPAEPLTASVLTSKSSSSSLRIYVTTEAAGRGLDLPEATHVFILGVPTSPAAYLHMAGRTARMGRPGAAITLLLDNQNSIARMRTMAH